MAESEDTEGEQAKEGVSYDAPNGGYRAEIMTGSVPGLSLITHLTLPTNREV